MGAMILLEDVLIAYYNCRKNKRNTRSALAFEVNYEQNCVDLWREINERSYTPRQSITFIVTRPVKREVFAADFRDRIVHHLLASKIVPLFEEEFIEETSNCRKGKGTLYGIKKLEESIRLCSREYKQDCYVLRLDIKSFFMSIQKKELLEKLKLFIRDRYKADEIDTIIYLLETIMMNTPEKNCMRHSPLSAWKDIPVGKSLFTCGEGRGIPIGDLISQLVANFLLNDMDHWLHNAFHYYGRYVDDFYIVSCSKDKLLAVIPKIRDYLTSIGLTLHPDKMYLQHHSKGVKYIGAVVKPGRKYIANRTRSNFQKAIIRFNKMAITDKYIEEHAEEFMACINSYMGICKHFSTYSLRRRMMNLVDKRWWRVAYISGHFEKISIKRKYRNRSLTNKL